MIYYKEKIRFKFIILNKFLKAYMPRRSFPFDEDFKSDPFESSSTSEVSDPPEPMENLDQEPNFGYDPMPHFGYEPPQEPISFEMSHNPWQPEPSSFEQGFPSFENESHAQMSEEFIPSSGTDTAVSSLSRQILSMSLEEEASISEVSL